MQTAYEHCELSVNGETIHAVAEAPEAYDVSVIHRMKWQTMTFNAFQLGSAAAVENAYDVLREGGVVIETIHELPWFVMPLKKADTRWNRPEADQGRKGKEI